MSELSELEDEEYAETLHKVSDRYRLLERLRVIHAEMCLGGGSTGLIVYCNCSLKALISDLEMESG